MDTKRRAGNGQLPRPVPRWLTERSFLQRDIPAVRQFARAFGARAQLHPARLDDFVLAASEATASATACGPRAVRVRLWVTGHRAYCEVRSDGALARHSGGPVLARPGEVEALRRSVLRRLSDYVSLASDSDGIWVLLSMTVA
ncbi:MAG TPA: hypothetical protein VGG83_18310 [Trebonia sp.]